MSQQLGLELGGRDLESLVLEEKKGERHESVASDEELQRNPTTHFDQLRERGRVWSDNLRKECFDRQRLTSFFRSTMLKKKRNERPSALRVFDRSLQLSS